MITNETINSISIRSNGRCENPRHNGEHVAQWGDRYHIHHIYWRSQYRNADRDDLWNLAYLCEKCHRSIHDSANTELDSFLKSCADSRKPRCERSTQISKSIIKERKRRHASYKRSVQKFKEKNAGLSPTQVAYRRAKAYRDSLPK